MPQQPTLVAPSLLAADFTRLAEEIAAIERAGADWLHLDIMDGHFVPNISFGPGIVKSLRKLTRLPFDVHLMIAPADPYIQAFADAGADHILIHPESGPHPHRTLQAIRALGKKPGLVLNPGTPLHHVAPLIDLLDIILVMSVNPGFGGQKFIHTQVPRVAELRQMIDAQDRVIRLEMDGGIDPHTAPPCIAAGADTLVAGTAVFGAPDYAHAIAAIRGQAAA
jgi:ribulose-phosphate 3-epimerase